MEGARNEEIQNSDHEHFIFWRDAFTESNPEIQLPKEGTASDVFKTVLRHFITEYGRKLSPETITTIELQYLVQGDLGPEDFLKAEKLIEHDLEK
jgi:hypothetical protein